MAGPGPEELIWAAVDFDGTLASSVWPDPGIGDPIRKNVAKVRELKARGFKVVVHTARGWESYQPIEDWLTRHHVPFDKIVPGKLLARIYVDDRNVDPTSSTWLPEYHGL